MTEHDLASPRDETPPDLVALWLDETIAAQSADPDNRDRLNLEAIRVRLAVRQETIEGLRASLARAEAERDGLNSTLIRMHGHDWPGAASPDGERKTNG